MELFIDFFCKLHARGREEIHPMCVNRLLLLVSANYIDYKHAKNRFPNFLLKKTVLLSLNIL